jgi:hypothetical protein
MKTSAQKVTKTDAIQAITTITLDIGTLETRNSDSLDFHDLSVWQIREALEQAYEAGRNSK